MNPNSDEIRAARALLARSGYISLHIAEDATWSIGGENEIGTVGLCVECDTQDAYDQMIAIKRTYRCEAQG